MRSMKSTEAERKVRIGQMFVSLTTDWHAACEDFQCSRKRMAAWKAGKKYWFKHGESACAVRPMWPRIHRLALQTRYGAIIGLFVFDQMFLYSAGIVESVS